MSETKAVKKGKKESTKSPPQTTKKPRKKRTPKAVEAPASTDAAASPAPAPIETPAESGEIVAAPPEPEISEPLPPTDNDGKEISPTEDTELAPVEAITPTPDGFIVDHDMGDVILKEYIGRPWARSEPPQAPVDSPGNNEPPAPAEASQPEISDLPVIEEPPRQDPAEVARPDDVPIPTQKRKLLSRLKPSATPRPRRPHTKISQDQPQFYEAMAWLLPKSPLFVLCLILAFDAMISLLKGDVWFWMRWYEATWIGPQIVGIFTYPGGPGEWLSDYWILVVLIAMCAMTLAFVIRALPWRFCFKDYVIVRGHNKHPDGRVMWHSANTWTRLWDQWYGTEPRTELDLWIKQGWRWNPLLPNKGLTHLTLDIKEDKPKIDVFSIEARERRYRRFVGYDHVVTTDQAQQSREIPLDRIGENFKARGERLVLDTHKFSLANPDVRLRKLENGAHMKLPGLKEAADLARQRRGE